MSVAESTPQHNGVDKSTTALFKERLNKTPITISPPKEKNGGHFLAMLDSEINRLTTLCQKAETDLRYNVMPEEVSGCIRTAIGKSQLLLTKKFKQFRKLCEDNLRPRIGEQKIMSADLQGFWDLIAMPISDVHRMFDDIDQIRKSKWKESALLEVQKKKEPVQSPRTKRAANKPKKAKSSEDEEKARKEVRGRIAEARRLAKLRMADEQASGNGEITIEVSDNSNGLD